MASDQALATDFDWFAEKDSDQMVPIDSDVAAAKNSNWEISTQVVVINLDQVAMMDSDVAAARDSDLAASAVSDCSLRSTLWLSNSILKLSTRT